MTSSPDAIDPRVLRRARALGLTEADVRRLQAARDAGLAAAAEARRRQEREGRRNRVRWSLAAGRPLKVAIVDELEAKRCLALLATLEARA